MMVTVEMVAVGAVGAVGAVVMVLGSRIHSCQCS